MEKFEPRKKKDLEVTFHNRGLVANAEAGSPVSNPHYTVNLTYHSFHCFVAYGLCIGSFIKMSSLKLIQ